MSAKIFLNLPVSNLKRSMDFYSRIGFSINPQFTDDKVACMVFSEEIYVMLLSHPRFSDFTSKPIADTRVVTTGIYALEVGSPEAMQNMADNAIAAGGKEFSEPKDYGFMQQRSFEDPDGHLWEVFYADMSKFQSVENG